MSLTFYFSGVGDRATQVLMATHCRARLLSCHGNYMLAARQWAEAVPQVPAWKQRPILLDSGAFTAWKSGHPISIEEVTRNYEQVLGWFGDNIGARWLLNLDTIPGTPGAVPTPDELKRAVEESDVNFELLKRRFGPIILPVFHQGEPTERLLEVCAQAQYIGLSPRQDLPESARVTWCSQTHGRIRAINPAVRTHGLATTGLRIMHSGTWHSVDSASWVVQAGLGVICMWENGRMTTIGVSEKSPARKEWDAHYDTLPKSVQDAVDERAAALEIPPGGLRVHAMWRQLFNLDAYQRMADAATKRGQNLMGALF